MTALDHDVFARSLLESARADAPRSDALSRELARLGVAGVVVSAGTAAGAAAAQGAVSAGTKPPIALEAAKEIAVTTTTKVSSSLAVVAGKVALGVVVAATTAAVALSVGDLITTRERPTGAPGVVEARHSAMPPAPSERAHIEVPAEGALDDLPSGANGPGEVDVERAASAEDETARAASRQSSPTTRTVTSPMAAARPSSRGAVDDAVSLSDEVALIDRARATVASHPSAAIAILDAHARRFPRGALRDEAAVLRVEALLASGDHAAAVRVATPYLDARAKAPVNARMRALIGDEAIP